MDRPLHERHLQADPFGKPGLEPSFAETDQWGFGFEHPPEEATTPKSTQDIREVYLRSQSGVTASAGVSMPDVSRWLTIASRAWARVPSPFPLDRRVVAGLGLVGVAGALLVGLSRYDLAPSIKTASDTTYTSAVGQLSSAAGAARDLVGQRPVVPVTTEAVATNSRKKVASVRPATGVRRSIDISPALQPVPLFREERVPAFRDERVPAFRDERFTTNGPAPIEPTSKEAPAFLEDESALETAPIYSLDDADVRPPVAVRTPGIASARNSGDKYVSLIEILVSETGQVESARGRQRPGSLGAALQSNTALSVVKTWRFRPARRNGQPVKYRTTVPFIETFNPAGTTDATR